MAKRLLEQPIVSMDLAAVYSEIGLPHPELGPLGRGSQGGENY